MPSLREEITKTVQRLIGREQPLSAASDETSLAADPREGRQFAAFRILRRLGHGGMGQVYLALDTRLGRHVALKFLPSGIASDPSMLHRLQQEARTASALNHPNILTIYDIGEVDGEHFIASEYVDGVTLRTAIDHRQIDPARAVDIAIQVASALSAAHSVGVVHRDLKPSNIMIRPDGLVKVIDFGIAKLMRDRASPANLTQPGIIIGTVDYMSPEQARGEAVDQRSDLWSLGIVLYEIAAKKLPFDGATESHVIVAILDQPLPEIPPAAGVSPQFGNVISRALQKDPAKRYSSAPAMLSDLRQLVEPSRGGSVRKPRRMANFPRRAVLGAVAGAAICALIAFASWWWRSGGKERLLGPDWFEAGAIQRVTANGKVQLAAISPNGRYLAYTAAATGGTALYIRQIASRSEIQVPAFNGLCNGLSFAPDNGSVYYVVRDQTEMGRLLNVPVTGGASRPVLEDIDGPIAFSPDGKQFAFMRKKEIEGGTVESILVASVADASDQRAILTKSDTQVGWTLAWSPAPVLVDAFFPIRLNRAAQPIISVLSPSGVVKQEIPVSGFRRLRYPVWLNHGSLLLFAALADGSTDFEQRVQEFSVYSGKSRPLESPMALGSLSATLDGNFVAAVGLKQESSLWIANPNQPATKQMAESGSVRSFAWVDGGVVFPSARGGSVNLWETLAGGRARPVGKARPCVEYEPSYLPGNAVVYSSNCASGGGDFNIWKTDLQTGVATQLTSGGNFDTYPEASPDGKWVIYNSWPSNVPSIWKVATAGGMPNRVYSEQGRNAVFSADGLRIVCQVRAGRGNPWRVVILAFSDGHVLQEIPSVPANPDVPIRWSPDGAALEYVAGTGGHSILWRQPLTGGSPVQILNVPGENIHDFARRPDGKRLAYVQSRADSDVVLIRRANRP